MSKIQNTYNSGYRIDHDFDARKHTDEQKRLKRERAKNDPEAEAVKRQTWMLPFNVLCDSCSKRIGKGTKVYANVKKLGKERKYLGKITIYSLQMRCIFCAKPIVFETDPEASDYKVISGGKRTEGDWKELREKALEADAQKAREKAMGLDDEQTARQQALEEGQRNAARAEELTKFLDRKGKINLHQGIQKAMELVANRPEQEPEEDPEGIPTSRMLSRPDADDGEEFGDFDDDEWEKMVNMCSAEKTAVGGTEPKEATAQEGEKAKSKNPWLLDDDSLPAAPAKPAPTSTSSLIPKKKKGGALSSI